MNESKVYAEVFFILEQVPYSYISMLPKELMCNLKDRMSVEHYKSFNKEKVFVKQKFNKKTMDILKKIYQKYWK